MDDLQWWEELHARYFVEQSLGRLDDGDGEKNSLTRCEAYLDALNLLVTGLRHVESETPDGEEAALKCVLSRTDSGAREILLASAAIKDLRNLEPLILSQHDLNRAHYDPYAEISAELRTKASEVHRKLNSAVDSFKALPGSENGERLLRKIASVLFVVRNNIAHGEKSVRGPDVRKAERDRSVSAVIAPLIDAVIASVLGDRKSALALYGTLRTGGSNSVMFDVPEERFEGEVSGSVAVLDGLPYFTLTSWRDSSLVPIEYVSSSRLAKLWNRLDSFEGTRYRRHSVLARLSDGRHRVAQIYAAADAKD